MHEAAFMEVVQKIREGDTRYEAAAYVFVREALDFAVKWLDKPQDGARRHVSGQELLEGIRVYALREFGPMTRSVLESWGVRATEDFGEIVFALVDGGILGRTEEDSRADFAGGYDFQEAFAKPFLPERPVRTRRTARKKKAFAVRNSDRKGDKE